jgi:hypothetical protein
MLVGAAFARGGITRAAHTRGQCWGTEPRHIARVRLCYGYPLPAARCPPSPMSFAATPTSPTCKRTRSSLSPAPPCALSTTETATVRGRVARAHRVWQPQGRGGRALEPRQRGLPLKATFAAPDGVLTLSSWLYDRNPPPLHPHPHLECMSGAPPHAHVMAPSSSVHRDPASCRCAGVLLPRAARSGCQCHRHP